METNQDTRSQASYISVAASLTAKLRCCFRGDTTTTNISESFNPRGGIVARADPEEDPPGENITIAVEEAPPSEPPSEPPQAE